MKHIHSFLSILAAAALALACMPEQVIPSIPEFKPEQSYLGIPYEGGVTSTGVLSKTDWSFEDSSIPDWLTVTPRKGGPAVNSIVFAADKNTAASDRTANLIVNVAGKQQRFTVVQSGPGAFEAPLSTIAQVAAGADGEVFRIRATVTGVRNTSYGNIDVEDETGSIYIYGLFNGLGQYPKDASGGWSSFGIEPGDIITVQGPRTLYNGTTLELVDATLIKVEKSLIDVDPSAIELESAEAGTFTISVVSKADGMAVLPSESWIKLTDIAAGAGGAAVYSFAYEANTTTAARTASVVFKATNSSKSVSVTQPGVPPTGQSITEIVALPDNSGVETLESTVVAKTTKGFVLSDGATAIYAYDNGANAVELGNVVKVLATKTTYNGVPELASITSVEKTDDSSWSHPTVKDITASAVDYAATVAEYIQFTGTLKKSGNYYNVEIDGVDPGTKQGSIVYPIDALNAASFDGKAITVTGYFNGISGGGKYINVIATKIVEANAKGSLSNPYTPAEAAAAVADLKWTSNSDYEHTDEVYVAGKICRIANKGTYTEGGTYGNATFFLSGDGTGDGEFQVFRALYLGNVKFTEGKTDIKVGDDVVIYGQLMNYQGNTPETVSGKAYLYSLNGKTE